jgi:hypothetical protein
LDPVGGGQICGRDCPNEVRLAADGLAERLPTGGRESGRELADRDERLAIQSGFIALIALMCKGATERFYVRRRAASDPTWRMIDARTEPAT